MNDMPDSLTAATFAPHIGTVFTASIDGQPVALLLAEVDAGSPQPSAPRQDPFTLLFTSATPAGLAQGTYALAHDSLGALELFLVPRAPKADGLARLEAVFN